MSNAKHPIHLLKPLSDELIAQKGFDLIDIWVVKLGDDIKGPYHTKQIRELAHKYPNDMPNLVVCNLKEENWQGFFQATAFQRRQVFHVDQEIKKKVTNILVFKDGQKLGPYHVNDIEAEIKAGKFLRSDLLSTDKGHTWIKIYEHPHFDRRTREAESLPLSPKSNSFEISHENTHYLLSIKSKFIQPESKGIDSLAQLTGDKTTTITFSPEDNNKSSWKNSLAYVGIAVGIFLCVFTLFDGPPAKTRTTRTTAKVQKKAPIKRKVSSTTRKPVTRKTPPRRVVPKKRTPVRRPIKRVVRKPRKARRIIKTQPHVEDREREEDPDEYLDRDPAASDYDEDEIEELKSELMEQLSEEEKEMDEYKDEFDDDEGRY